LVAVSAVALVALLPLQGGASGASLPDAGRPQVLKLSLTGVVDPFMASYVQRGIRAAAGGHDSAVAITVDTPGGLDSSMREIVRSIIFSPVPVICYVPSGADAASALNVHVIDRVAPSLQDMLPSGDQLAPFHRSLGESFFHAFADPDVAFILLDIGFLALIVWAFHPGFHVPLAVGVVSSALGLAILETLPVRLAGFGLLLVAAVLFVLDLKARAHGVLTVGGIVVFVLGGLLLFNPSVPNARISPPRPFTLPVAVGVARTVLRRAMLAAM